MSQSFDPSWNNWSYLDNISNNSEIRSSASSHDQFQNDRIAGLHTPYMDVNRQAQANEGYRREYNLTVAAAPDLLSTSSGLNTSPNVDNGINTNPSCSSLDSSQQSNRPPDLWEQVSGQNPNLIRKNPDLLSTPQSSGGDETVVSRNFQNFNESYSHVPIQSSQQFPTYETSHSQMQSQHPAQESGLETHVQHLGIRHIFDLFN